VQMKKSSDFLKRREEVTEFNKKHKWLKRGISMTHCRYAFGRRTPFHAPVIIYGLFYPS